MAPHTDQTAGSPAPRDAVSAVSPAGGQAGTLPRRTLGATGLSVTPIGLGLAALGRPGYINLRHADDLTRDYDPAAMQTRAHATLDAAWAAGVRYFDAARSYGRAEEFL